MNIRFTSKIPWLSLSLFSLTYALIGWYLSAHHIVWLVGAFVATAALAITWKSSPLLTKLVEFCSQGLIVILVTSMVISMLVALAVTWSMLLKLFVVPLAATFLAEIEMESAGFCQINKFLFLATLAGLGLSIGEAIDIGLIPSIRY